MNKKRNCKRWLAVFAMLSALMLGSIIASAASGDTVTVKVTGTYGQTEARSMLKMINDFRTGSDAWYYTDESKKQRYTYNTDGNIKLSKLEYDYDLEEIAMQRAMEIAIFNEHGRPCYAYRADGQYSSDECVFSLFSCNYGGENIAAGYPTATDVFVGWQEEEFGFSGQGHRRNMLSPNFTAIGIGHVEYNGYDYWVQVFRSPTGSTVETPANDSENTESIEVLVSNIIDSDISVSDNSLSLSYGDSVSLPEISCKIQLNGTWPKRLCPLNVSPEWSVTSGDDCVSIDPDSGKVSGVKCGIAELSASVMGELVKVSVEVTPKPIDDAIVTLDSDADLSYTGDEIQPPVTVMLGGTALTMGEDYDVTYLDNINVGEASLTVTGVNNYTGEKTISFDIQPYSLENCTAEAIEAQVYTGAELKPDLVVLRQPDLELIPGEDYTVSYDNNINVTDVDKAVVTAIGIGNYSGELEVQFDITPQPLNDEFELTVPDQTFTGDSIVPSVTVTWNGTVLKAETDYTQSYDNNTNAGTASVTIEGTGNFSDELTGEFQILQADLSDCTVKEIPGQTYCGEALTPELTVSLGDYTLTAETDYTAKYSDNTEVGTATVTLSAPENGTGNFAGTKTVTFDILPIDLVESEAIVRPIEDQTYTGSSIEPEVVVELDGQALKADIDYTVSCKNNQDAGKASVTVKGTGNYTGTLSADFTILPAALSDEFLVTIPNQPYTGAPVEPSVSIQWGDIELVEDEDFSVAYTGDHTDAGTVKLTISGKGNYSGAIEESFQILSVDLSYCSVSPIHDQTYTGAEIFPEFTVSLGDYELIEGKDYTTSYDNNIELTTARSKAEIMLSGQGNFKGLRSLTFNIIPINLAKDGAAIQAIGDQTYTGEAITPEVTVILKGTPLVEGTDYEVSYSNNTDAGTAAVTVTGLGNYTGELTAAFQILPKQLAEDDCTFGEIPEQTYTGAAIKPAVTVMLGEKALTADVDYTVAYSNNTKVGEATAVVTAAGNYSGELGSVSFAIVPADLADCTAEPIADQSYTGSAITPAVTVRLGENALVQVEDYTVSYENNVEIGTATVTLTGTGNFRGTLTLHFAIIAPAAPEPTPGTSTPEAPGSGTSDSGASDLGSGIPTTDLPQKGAVKKDPATGATYRITESSASGAAVEYMAPANKKKTTVTIPDVVVINQVPCKVTSIAANAFKNNKKLKKVIVGKNVTTIGKNAFRGCTKLTTVKLNAKITKINAAAFSSCTALKSITIPASIRTIGKQAFYKCSRLKSITIKTKKLNTKAVGKMAFSRISRKAVVKVPASKKKAYRTLLRKKGLPASVKIK